MFSLNEPVKDLKLDMEILLIQNLIFIIFRMIQKLTEAEVAALFNLEYFNYKKASILRPFYIFKLFSSFQLR